MPTRGDQDRDSWVSEIERRKAWPLAICRRRFANGDCDLKEIESPPLRSEELRGSERCDDKFRVSLRVSKGDCEIRS